MNKPQRQTHIDELTGSQLHNKKNDILYCIESAKSVDALEAYERQLDYIQKVIASRKQLALNLKQWNENQEKENGTQVKT